jgi:hypothetical protein
MQLTEHDAVAVWRVVEVQLACGATRGAEMRAVRRIVHSLERAIVLQELPQPAHCVGGVQSVRVRVGGTPGHAADRFRAKSTADGSAIAT